jgi:hypothetical protein
LSRKLTRSREVVPIRREAETMERVEAALEIAARLTPL